jgi:mRNA-degrading endonuclease toxin of MazEF toxin-antitoxin module
MQNKKEQQNKDFDKWNTKKKELNYIKSHYYKEREIRWCSLGVNIGFEEDGTSHGYKRPVLILRGFSRDVCLVVPLTTSKKKNKYYLNIGQVEDKEAFVILSQIRLIDTKRLHDRLSILDTDRFEKIRKAIRDLI